MHLTDHKTIGLQYALTALVFLAGGVVMLASFFVPGGAGAPMGRLAEVGNGAEPTIMRTVR